MNKFSLDVNELEKGNIPAIDNGIMSVNKIMESLQ